MKIKKIKKGGSKMYYIPIVVGFSVIVIIYMKSLLDSKNTQIKNQEEYIGLLLKQSQ